MAGSCEISNIFSNYISAMYQPDEVQPTLDMLGHLGDDSTLGLSLPSSQTLAQSTEKPEWFSELPYFWTKVQVLEWISYHVEKNKYDASCIDFSCCNMDGHALCHCTRDQMRLIFGPLGDELYDRLWEFIRDILIHPELNEGLMKWEDRREGVFKFLRSEAVAQLWGQKKKNSSMTYEKLSRAMRYYYKREILERVDGRRLVYKFGKNSSGWKEEEILSRKKDL